jgi:alpha-L-glutamate ligase-like protein
MLRALLDLLELPARAHDVMGINGRNRALVREHNRREHYPYADDKLRTKEMLEATGVPTPRTLHAFTGMHEAAHSPETLASLDDFVIKPTQGSGGEGILVILSRNEDGWIDTDGKLWTPAMIRHHVSNIIFGNYANGLSDRAMVEERLLQAPPLGDVAFPGLPDIRVITLGGRPLMSMLRIPTTHSHGKANLHQGAIGVGVDLATGRAIYASFRGAHVERHPDTGTVVEGVLVNRWSEILEVARRTAAVLPLGYLGIDIALDRSRGPLVLEVNARPGLEIQNANRRGLREAIRSTRTPRTVEP